MRQIEKNGKFAVYADAWSKPGTAIDVFAGIKSKSIEIASNQIVMPARTIVTADNADNGKSSVAEKLDITTWLPFAAPKYKISPNIDDYIFVPVFTIPSELPNRNGVAFPLKTLLEFNVDCGRQGYKTFKGMPVHYEHKNDVPAEAKGVIADCFLRPLRGYGNGKIWKVMLLLAIDRTKDPVLSQQIINKEMNSYSMGAWVDKYTCSLCGSDVGKCSHIPDNSPLCFYEKDGELCFKNMHGMKGFECSSVGVPAWSPATSDFVMM